MEVLGYIASATIGISLGLIGSGGSILTLPVLVYLFQVPPITATAYSLFIVGLTSLVGTWPKYRAGSVDLRTAAVFGIPSIVAVYLTRKLLVPLIPEELFRIGGWMVSGATAIMLLFGLMMLAAAISMILNTEQNTRSRRSRPGGYYPFAMLEGLLVGGLTGLVGAGGGFLIIPALVLLGGLSIETAIGTSLLIIAAKSLIGFTGDLAGMQIEWAMLLSVSGLAIAGFYIGDRLSRRLPAPRLQQAFGWFVLAMGSYVILKELWNTFNR